MAEKIGFRPIAPSTGGLAKWLVFSSGTVFAARDGRYRARGNISRELGRHFGHHFELPSAPAHSSARNGFRAYSPGGLGYKLWRYADARRSDSASIASGVFVPTAFYFISW
jgi:hypothetical protein